MIAPGCRGDSMKVGARFLALAIEEMMEHPPGKLAACLKVGPVPR